MPHLILNTCIGCTACLRICPTEAIFGDKQELHQIVPERCIDCGACAAVCPVECIEDQNKVIKPKRKIAALPKAKVDPDFCTGCEFCVDACPYDCISMEGGERVPGVLPVAVVEEKKCVGCGLCTALCDKDAILVYDDKGERIDQSFLKLWSQNEYSQGTARGKVVKVRTIPAAAAS